MKDFVVFFRVFKSNARCYFNFLKLSVFIIALCHASFVSADDDFSPQQCSNLKRKDGFSIAFTVPAPTPVTITFTSNNSVVELWSSVSGSNAKIIDSDVNPGERVLLIYDPTSDNGKQGRLIYKLDTGSGYIQQQPPVAMSISGGNGTLLVSGDTVVVECAEGEKEPDPVPDLKDVNYEFGVIEGSNCTGGCDLVFKNRYSDPIVFLMSTIDSDKINASAPTKASVGSISLDRRQATIISESPPGTGNTDRMYPIYYFVTEPGKLEFLDSNGDVVYGQAGTVSTTKSQCKGKACGGGNDYWETVNLNSSIPSMIEPVIMAQVQGKDSEWATTAISGLSSNGFKLALETGRQGHATIEKKVAYLAIDAFYGTDKDRATNLVFDQAGEFNQTNNPGYSSSIAWSCDKNEISLNHPQQFEKFGVIANKQTRSGGDGGWLRYCKQTNNKFTFAFDEDTSSLGDRKHRAMEQVGYFAFENKQLELDVCEYFPTSVQTNSYYQDKPHASKISFSGDRIKLFLDSKYDLSFNEIASSSLSSGCVYGEGGVAEDCGFDATLSYNDPSSGFYYPPTLPDFKYGSAVADCTAHDCNGIVTPGQFERIKISGDRGELTLSPGEYWVRSLVLSGNSAKINIKGKVVIHYESIDISKDFIQINANGNYENLIFVGHQSGGGRTPDWLINNHDITVNASVYIDSTGFGSNGVVLQGTRTNLTGALAVQQILVTNHDNNIYAKVLDGCTTPEPSDSIKYIVIDPNNYHLTCDDTAQVYVTPYDDNDQPMDDVDGESVSISAQGVTFSNGSFDSQNKRFVFDIDSRDGNQYGAIPVTANVVGTAIEDTSDLIFVPLKFEINNEEYIELIAGQQKGSIPIKALACDSTGKPISLGYSVDLDETNITQTQFIPNSGDSTPLDLDVSVTNGEGSISIKFDESGMFEGDLKAPISCDDFPNAEDCPENTIKEVVGKVKFKARPWKIAICDVKETSAPSNLNPASTSRDTGFMASGDEFSITYRPITYAEVNIGADECQLPITTNYALDNGPLPITRQVIYPVGNANAGDLVLSQVSPSFLPSDSGGVKEFNDNSWNEVGSFEVKTYEVNDGSNTANPTYLGMTLDSDSQLIGRFYPKYFSLYDQAWVEPNSQSYIYMNQNFDSVSFEVEALNSKKQTVINYANVNYSSNLRAKFNLMESGLYTSRFVSPDFGNGSWTAQIGSLGEFSHSPKNNSICGDNSSLCWIKQSAANNYEDGPFNFNGSLVDNVLTTPTDISIVAGVGNVDPVEFVEGGQKLTIQPDIRFGRIDLDDVGGNSGTAITIPLRTEYWNGSRFVVNDVDSTTNVAASSSASYVIWSEGGSVTTTVTLANGGQVSDGESRDLTASQNPGVNTREQVQLWQSMDDTPWLRYDWGSDKVSDVNGEQDPSTVVTFGIYRGNDRVIYRGESGLTGQ
ncbi:DUF6701 domain-containing protein [Vibrio splendidus]|uniref:DUF6701 domain-containing protein n=1 Tax=Vibrio splendidus TaxID=29497 RepID=UPI000D36A1DD|nr:DUF6701 domain-containing protein [Vibrio splendidus]PTO62566.1 MSHA biogenesis protein MshQ [Vibrio splendidus]